MRNVEKTIDNGRKLIRDNPKMTLAMGEMQELYERNYNGSDLFNFMSDSFFFGVTIGYRIAKKRKKELMSERATVKNS